MNLFKIYGLAIICILSITNLLAQNQSKVDSARKLVKSGVLNEGKKFDALYWLAKNSVSSEEMLQNGEELLVLARASENTEYILKAYHSIGIAYRFRGELDKALEYQFKCVDQADGKKLFPLLSEVFTEISICYILSGNSENSMLYETKAIDALRKTDRKRELALRLLNAGFDYYLLSEYDSAMAYYNESEPILEESGMALKLAHLIGYRALVLWKDGNQTKAKEELLMAIQMLEQMGDLFTVASYYNQLGHICLEENVLDLAIRYAMKGLEVSLDEGLNEEIKDASNLLFQIYQKKGETDRALYYQTQYFILKDSIQNQETTQQLANLRAEFELGQKQAEVDLLLEQKRSNQIIMITGGIIFVAFVYLVIVTYSYLKSKNRLNKKLEEQKDSLVKLNQTKDKFFSIISHDLRGPVNSLSGLVNVSKYFANDGKSDQLLDMIDKMEISVDRLTRLLDNLLAWALQQRGHFPYFPENLNLKGVLEEVVGMFRDMAGSKKIVVDCDIEENIHLYTDKNATSTILRNLINNAIKFTPEGGRVQILAEAEADPVNKLGIVKVVDNGVGIPKDKLDNLFKLNEKVSTNGTSGETGLGLGLQLVYEFVELNKGKIEVESQPKKGTTFTILLPLD